MYVLNITKSTALEYAKEEEKAQQRIDEIQAFFPMTLTMFVYVSPDCQLTTDVKADVIRNFSQFFIFSNFFLIIYNLDERSIIEYFVNKSRFYGSIGNAIYSYGI